MRGLQTGWSVRVQVTVPDTGGWGMILQPFRACIPRTGNHCRSFFAETLLLHAHKHATKPGVADRLFSPGQAQGPFQGTRSDTTGTVDYVTLQCTENQRSSACPRHISTDDVTCHRNPQAR